MCRDFPLDQVAQGQHDGKYSIKHQVHKSKPENSTVKENNDHNTPIIDSPQLQLPSKSFNAFDVLHLKTLFCFCLEVIFSTPVLD